MAGKWERENGLYNYAQGVMEICPNVNPVYSVGTYSVGIEAISAYTRFSIEVHLFLFFFPFLSWLFPPLLSTHPLPSFAMAKTNTLFPHPKIASNAATSLRKNSKLKFWVINSTTEDTCVWKRE